jgi:hypothetical protein
MTNRMQSSPFPEFESLCFEGGTSFETWEGFLAHEEQKNRTYAQIEGLIAGIQVLHVRYETLTLDLEFSDLERFFRMFEVCRKVFRAWLGSVNPSINSYVNDLLRRQDIDDRFNGFVNR